MTKGTLYIIATPLGNLEDITLRALRILNEEVASAFCEDTRQTRKLLSHYNIQLPLDSLGLTGEVTSEGFINLRERAARPKGASAAKGKSGKGAGKGKKDE